MLGGQRRLQRADRCGLSAARAHAGVPPAPAACGRGPATCVASDAATLARSWAQRGRDAASSRASSGGGRSCAQRSAGTLRPRPAGRGSAAAAPGEPPGGGWRLASRWGRAGRPGTTSRDRSWARCARCSASRAASRCSGGGQPLRARASDGAVTGDHDCSAAIAARSSADVGGRRAAAWRARSTPWQPDHAPAAAGSPPPRARLAASGPGRHCASRGSRTGPARRVGPVTTVPPAVAGGRRGAASASQHVMAGAGSRDTLGPPAGAGQRRIPARLDGRADNSTGRGRGGRHER